jgi:hypothetical protein
MTGIDADTGKLLSSCFVTSRSATRCCHPRRYLKMHKMNVLTRAEWVIAGEQCRGNGDPQTRSWQMVLSAVSNALVRRRGSSRCPSCGSYMVVSISQVYEHCGDLIPLRAVQDRVAWCYYLLLANSAVSGVSMGGWWGYF